MPKILVIDDHAELRKLIATALGLEGYEVLEAENGAVGLTLARRHLPELILCDVMMDKVDGYAALQQLREDPATATIPCILMTGKADAVGMRQGMELGADDYLPKPFNLTQLKAAVEAQLKKQQILRQESERKLDSLRTNLSLALPHELRTPLNGILGFAEIIAEEYATMSREDICTMAKSIRVSGLRLNRLIENFLIYAHIGFLSLDSKGTPSLRQAHARDYAKLIEKVAIEKAASSERSNDLVLNIGSGSAAVTEEHITKIVEEIVDNAFKFSIAGTPVTIETETSGDRFSMTVKDRGRGMTFEQISAVGAYMQFERKFYEQQGAGLGLSIVKRLAELHEGSFKIVSEPAQGTSVSVILPA